jgi:hypothetical protein
MRSLSGPLILGLVALVAAGCEETVDDPTPSINTSVALNTASAVLMLGSLGAEAGHVAETPDFSFGACPTLDEDGDEIVADYGAGCAPGSGITADELSGLLTLISPATNSIAYGTTSAFGFADLPVGGDFTLATSRTGDDVQVDFDVDALSWTADGTERTLSGLFTLSVTPEGTTIDLTRAVLTRAGSPAVAIEAAGLFVAAGELGACPWPSAGRIDLEREGEEAAAVFDESSADAGAFTVTLDDGTEGQAVFACEPAPADGE